MINKNQQKRAKRLRRHARVRSIVKGTAERPRLSVFRSSSHIYAQLIDDENGVTLASATSKDNAAKSGKQEKATEVGKAISSKAKDKGISTIVFDRGGYRYQGRVKALADSARESGLIF